MGQYLPLLTMLVLAAQLGAIFALHTRDISRVMLGCRQQCRRCCRPNASKFAGGARRSPALPSPQSATLA